MSVVSLSCGRFKNNTKLYEENKDLMYLLPRQGQMWLCRLPFKSLGSEIQNHYSCLPFHI